MKNALTNLMLACAVFGGCGGSAPAETTTPMENMQTTTATVETPVQRQSPPASGEARDVHFPAITRNTLSNGLELNTVTSTGLPIVNVRLVIKSGGANDPRNMSGLAHLVSAMLNEGTRSRTAAQLAEEVEFLGADLAIGSSDETITISMRGLKDQLPKIMDILADVALNPAFSDAELTKLKRREIDRLALRANDPNFLAAREFYRVLYGAHPYSHVDTTTDVVNRVRRNDLVNWHRKHFLPNNAFFVVVGDVDAATVQSESTRVLGAWRRGRVEEPTYPAIPARTAREIILVDRPESVQSVFQIGNIGLARNSADWVHAAVANQVLGGSASSRLFMDLREVRSLTYGAYSRFGEALQAGTFRATASVRNEKTAEATAAFVEHLERIRREAAPQEELANAQRFLSDSFPLRIETAGNIADMIVNLRVFGLPDDYWDSYRSQIRAVTPAQALEAAQKYIQTDKALFVVVGRASAVLEPLRAYGPVTVMDAEGRVISRHEQVAAPATATAQ